MKKLLLVFVSLLVLSGNANAQCHLKPQLPYSGAALSAYCWDIVEITSNKIYPRWEAVSGKQYTSYDHGNGVILVRVEMYGYGHNPEVWMNSKSFRLVYSYDVKNDYRIIIGTVYYFYAEGGSLESGRLRVKNYWQTKASLYVK